MTMDPTTKRVMRNSALVLLLLGTVSVGTCHVLRERTAEEQKKSELEQRIKNAPHIKFKHQGLPGRMPYGFVQGPSVYELARRELKGIDAPAFVGSENAEDIYLADLLRRTREINSNYKLGERSIVVAADLTRDNTIGGVYKGKKVDR